ncbi:hypothetical protein [Ammoniphilus sp. 3BR4]|uniref:hypothetical protein n=1 Tax=Ammoniphilus sp. 3BR4 TaxID=3158265 RepID=UPI00346606DF
MFEWQIMLKEDKAIVLFKGDIDIEMTGVLEEEMMPAFYRFDRACHRPNIVEKTQGII